MLHCLQRNQMSLKKNVALDPRINKILTACMSDLFFCLKDSTQTHDFIIFFFYLRVGIVHQKHFYNN